MSSFVTPSIADTVLSSPSVGVYAGVLPVLALFALLILLFEKQVATYAAGSRIQRLSRCLNVGIGPLAIVALVIGIHELARVLG